MEEPIGSPTRLTETRGAGTYRRAQLYSVCPPIWGTIAIAPKSSSSLRRSPAGASFASALELVREGRAELHQREPFAPIYVRKRVTVRDAKDSDAAAAGVERKD